MENEELNISADLRSGKKNGRPSNSERSTSDAINDSLRLLAAETIRGLQKDVKSMDTNQRINLIGKILPKLALDSGKDEEDVAMDIMAEKSLKVEMRIKCVSGKRKTT